MATAKSQSKSQSNKTITKKCCMFSHLCKTKEEELHVCCSFCKRVDCEIRCCNSIESCKYITTPEECIKFSFSRGEVDLKEYAKYNKIYPHNKKDLVLIQEYIDEKNGKVKKERKKPTTKTQKKEELPEMITQSIKRGRGRPPKITVPNKEEIIQPKKRGRGRPPKNKEGENK